MPDMKLISAALASVLLEERGGKGAYEIETVKSGRLHHATVDLKSGQPASNEDSRINGASGSSMPKSR